MDKKIYWFCKNDTVIVAINHTRKNKLCSKKKMAVKCRIFKIICKVCVYVN